MQDRLVQVQDLSFWESHIGSSERRYMGSVQTDSGLYSGFSAAERIVGGWDYGWLFVEPEAFGTGLADALYEITTQGTSGLWCTYTLEGNTMSPPFLARRGWARVAAPQPAWAVALGHVYNRWEKVF